MNLITASLFLSGSGHYLDHLEPHFSGPGSSFSVFSHAALTLGTDMSLPGGAGMGPTPTSVCWVSLAPVSSTKEQGGPRALAALRINTFTGTDVQPMVTWRFLFLQLFQKLGRRNSLSSGQEKVQMHDLPPSLQPLVSSKSEQRGEREEKIIKGA